MSRPSNWYQMSFTERGLWEQADRRRQDVEDERDNAQEEAERSERFARDARRLADERASELRSVRDELDSTIADFETVLGELEVEISLRDEWLKEQGLYDRFGDWAAYRRGE
jgi:hypothetical protein